MTCPNCGAPRWRPAHAEWCWTAHPDQPVLTHIPMRPVDIYAKSGHWEPDLDMLGLGHHASWSARWEQT